MLARAGIFWLALVAAVLVPAVQATAPPTPDPDSPREFAPGEVLVRVARDGGGTPVPLDRILEDLGIEAREIRSVFPARHRATLLGDVYRLILDDRAADVPGTCAHLEEHPGVKYAEPNRIYRATLSPDDPYFQSHGSWGQSFDDQYGPKAMACEAAWDVTTGSAGVVVAVVDSGIDYNHTELRTRLWTNPGEIPDNGVDDDGNGYVDDLIGYDLCTYGGSPRDADPMDDRGHGTHVSGIIAAATDNSSGIAGISWQSRLMTLRALDASGYGYLSDLSEGIVYAADNGAAVINNSWGGEGWTAPQVLQDAVDHAHGLGAVVVAAAGNFNADALRYHPANMKKVITVSASDADDVRASWSNWGVKIDVAAPGVQVLSCLASGSVFEDSFPDRIVGGTYMHLDGTSMAAPHVSGLAALILAERPSLTNEEVRQVLRVSAADVAAAGWDEETGYGRADAGAALLVDAVLVASIDAPAHRAYLEGTVDVLGTASGPGFDRYRLEYGSGRTPGTWTLIHESTTEVSNGLLASWDASTLDDGEYTLRLDATDGTGTRFQDRVLVWVDRLRQPGWPVAVGGPVYSNPALRDLDGVPGPEVAAGVPVGSGEEAHGTYHVLTHDGNAAPGGWPQDTVDPVANSPALGDLDMDGSMEVVGSSMGYRQLYAWDAAGSPLPGFPVDVSRNTYIFQWGGYVADLSPVLADIDGDPDLEILIQSVGVVHAVNRDGSPVSGWPVTLMTLENLKRIKDPPALAVGDLDRDGRPEIVAYASYQESDYPYNWLTDVHVLDHDGTPMDTGAWPLHTDEVSTSSSPTLGDLDGDGDLEILIGGLPPDKGAIGYIHAWHHDGAAVAGWPVEAEYFVQTDPVLADLDGDGLPEVMAVSTGHLLYVFHPDGSPMILIPMTMAGNPHPVVADVDGDGAVEIVAGTFYGEVRAWNTDGSQVAQFPRRTWDLISTSVAVDDLDADGDLEIVAASKDRSLYAWDMPANLDPATLQWPSYRQGSHHTGRYIPPMPACGAVPDEMRNVRFSSGPVRTMLWDDAGAGTLYDLSGGTIESLHASGGAAGASCLTDDHPDTVWADLRPDPDPGAGYYYLVRGRNGCGTGTWGAATGGAERIPGRDCP